MTDDQRQAWQQALAAHAAAQRRGRYRRTTPRPRAGMIRVPAVIHNQPEGVISMTSTTTETENLDEIEGLDESEGATLGTAQDIADAMAACVSARRFAQTIRTLVNADRVAAAANIAGVLQQLDKAITCLGMLGGNPHATQF